MSGLLKKKKKKKSPPKKSINQKWPARYFILRFESKYRELRFVDQVQKIPPSSMACLPPCPVLGCVPTRNDPSKNNTKAAFKLFLFAPVCRLLRETISSARMSSFDTSTRPAKMEVAALKTACSCPCAGL